MVKQPDTLPVSAQIMEWLQAVKDPEIPALSIVELGMVGHIIQNENLIIVQILPTFSGCPAIDHIVEQVSQTLDSHGLRTHKVEVSFSPPWTSDRISGQGLKKLSKAGLSPPQRLEGRFFDLDMLEHAQCPNCGSHHTSMKSPFGPTLCRALHYCQNCKIAFEQFKPL